MKIRSFSFLVLLSILLVFVGCLKIQPRNPNVFAPAPNQGLQYKLIDSGVPHEYQVQLSWPPEYKKVRLAINQKTLIETFEAQYKLTLKDDESIEFRLEILSDKGSAWAGTMQVNTPKDLVLDHNIINLENDWDVQGGRLFLKSGSVIRTHGHLVQMKFTTIYSDGGLIETFPDGQTAKDGNLGRSGGEIKIESENAEGHLIVRLRGEQGGPPISRSGKVLSAGLPGAEPIPGECDFHMIVRANIPECECQKNPKAGSPGEAGPSGPGGEDGIAGGSSGRLQLEVQNNNGFTVDLNALAGEPSLPGDGYPGGPGGDGGSALRRGTRFGSVATCKDLPKGQAGPEGAKGPHGKLAAAGLIEASCVRIGRTESEVCK